MSYRLFLDDERFPVEEGCVIARSYDEAREIVLRDGVPEFISFDHDLGEGRSGSDFAHWLVNYLLDHPNVDMTNFSFYVHSQNPVGADRIRNLMNSFLDHIRKERFRDV